MAAMEKIGLFGGSFNPVHIGHLRAAIEAREALSLDLVEFIPTARPPHKAGEPILPFSLRARLLELAVGSRPGFRVNLMEGDRPGPSYTYDTLVEYGRLAPSAELYFLMGAGDLFNLPHWHRGMELGTLANLAVMSRQGEDFPDIAAFVAANPEFLGGGALAGERGEWPLPHGRRLIHLDIPRLDICASDIRKRWRRGRSPAYLLPEAVERELVANREAVTAAWGANDE